jgi:hypothetical protein
MLGIYKFRLNVRRFLSEIFEGGIDGEEILKELENKK